MHFVNLAIFCHASVWSTINNPSQKHPTSTSLQADRSSFDLKCKHKQFGCISLSHIHYYNDFKEINEPISLMITSAHILEVLQLLHFSSSENWSWDAHYRIDWGVRHQPLMHSYTWLGVFCFFLIQENREFHYVYVYTPLFSKEYAMVIQLKWMNSFRSS